jgi:hypothetical protein
MVVTDTGDGLWSGIQNDEQQPRTKGLSSGERVQPAPTSKRLLEPQLPREHLCLVAVAVTVTVTVTVAVGVTVNR